MSGGEEDMVPTPPRLRPRVVSWASVASDSTLADDEAYNEQFSLSHKQSHSNGEDFKSPLVSPGGNTTYTQIQRAISMKIS